MVVIILSSVFYPALFLLLLPGALHFLSFRVPRIAWLLRQAAELKKGSQFCNVAPAILIQDTSRKRKRFLRGGGLL